MLFPYYFLSSLYHGLLLAFTEFAGCYICLGAKLQLSNFFFLAHTHLWSFSFISHTSCFSLMEHCFLICRLSKGFCEGLPTTQCWSEAVASHLEAWMHLEAPREKILGCVNLYDMMSFRSVLTGGKSTSILVFFFSFYSIKDLFIFFPCLNR